MGVHGIVAVDADIGHHAFAHELALDVVAQERELFGLPELDGQADFDLARDLGVLAALGLLYRVPQGLTVEDPRGSAVGREDFGVLDAALSGVVVGDAGGLFDEQRA